MGMPESLEIALAPNGSALLRVDGRVGVADGAGLHWPDFVRGAERGDESALTTLDRIAAQRAHDAAPPESPPDAVLSIVLRRRSKVVFIGTASAAVREGLGGLDIEYRDGFGPQVTIQSRGARVHPATALAAPGGPAIDASLLRATKVVVVALPDVATKVLVAAFREIGSAGVPVLPVVFAPDRIELGPLIVGGVERAFARSRLGAAYDESVEHALFEISTGSMPEMSQDGEAALAAALRDACEVPRAEHATRVTHVHCDGTTLHEFHDWTRLFEGESLKGELFGIDTLFARELPEGRCRESLVEGALVSIKDCFVEGFADSVHEVLVKTRAWRLHEAIERDFFYHHHNVYRRADFHPSLALLFLLFSSEATIAWVERISGQRCDAPPAMSPSWYMPGDHSTPHRDSLEGRRIAFIWHLTRSWQPEWGGHLVWCPTGATLRPDFNVLHLFDVTHSQSHFVMTVSPAAEGRRLTWNGWWKQRVPPAAVARPAPVAIGDFVQVHANPLARAGHRPGPSRAGSS